MIRQAAETQATEAEKKVLVLCARLYGLWQVEEQGAWFLKCGYFNGKQMDAVQEEVSSLCLEMRKIASKSLYTSFLLDTPSLTRPPCVAVPVVDSFAFGDHIINSPLGRYDGHIYEAYFNQVRAENPPVKEHPYFARLIYPLLNRPAGPEEEEDVEEEMGLEDELKEMRKSAEQGQKAKVTTAGKGMKGKGIPGGGGSGAGGQ